jgi:pyruvate dehydrogenase E2 component (dihydrolipoamide acetyltransferase)
VPDIGSDEAEVIEICVAVGDAIEAEDSLVVLESDKASMEVPSPKAGVVESIEIKEGTTAKEGDVLVTLKIQGEASPAPVPKTAVQKPLLGMNAVAESNADEKPEIREPVTVAATHQPVEGISASRPTGEVYAGPAVRKMSREVGLDLALVPGSGPKGRITKDDVKAFVKSALQNKAPVPMATAGSGIPQVPEVDFSQFGEVNIEPMSKLHKVTAANMHRSWLNVPHVTGFDEIDITELEEFRKSLKAEGEKAGVKVTPLPFLLRAAAASLKAHPKLNASLSADGQSMVYKNYCHIGIAVDTPAGLMVPVIRDVDKKSLFELAAEATELAQKAKDRKLKPAEMQGGTFTISSLGPMGGTGFTPIVNTPEVAILGVSKLDIKPRWNGSEFEPRKMLPVSLSYDHRAVNGADAGKFLMTFNQLLSDIRRFIL